MFIKFNHYCFILFVLFTISSTTVAGELDKLAMPFQACVLNGEDPQTDDRIVTVYAWAEGLAGIKIRHKEYRLHNGLNNKLPLAKVKGIPGNENVINIYFKKDWSIVITFFTLDKYDAELKEGQKNPTITALSCQQLKNSSDDSKEEDLKEYKLDKLLTQAAETGDLEKVKAAHQEHGLKIDGKYLGQDALERSVVYGYFEIAKYLIENGANPNRGTRFSESNMLIKLITTQRDDVKMAQLLIDHGASLSGSEESSPALVVAASYGSIEIVKLLLNQPKVKIQERDSSALYSAVAEGHLEIAKLLIETKKADLRWKDPYENTPIIMAAVMGHVTNNVILESKEAMLEYLLSINMEIDTTNKWGYTTLMKAAEYYDLSKTNLLQQLIDAGANVNRKGIDYQGNTVTALSLARLNRNMQNVDALIKAGGTE